MKYRWQESTLGEICTFLTGKAFPKNEQGLKEGAYPFIKVSDMNLPKNYKKIHTAQNWISKETALRLKIKLAPKGACVFAKIGEAIKSERIRELTRDTAIDNNLMAAIPKNNFCQQVL